MGLNPGLPEGGKGGRIWFLAVPPAALLGAFWPIESGASELVGEEGLFPIVVVMGVVVAHPPAGFAGSGGMSIADGLGDGRIIGRQGGVHCQDRSVALGSIGDIDHGLGQGDAGLGPADLLHGAAGGLA